MNGTRTSLITSLLVIALVSLHSPSANAYVVLKTWSGKNKHWTDSSVKWSIDSTVPMPGLTDDQFEDALGAAFDAWEAVSCGTIMFSGQGFSNPAGAIRTMVNTNSWDPTVGDALAYTVNDNDKDGIISSAEIVFNAVEAEWTVSTSAPPGMNDVQGVMTHEVGHAIGLDHSRHLEATMFFSGGSSHLRTLEPDDKRGLCYLYPAVPFEDGQACDTCHNSAHCADGYCLDFGGGNGFCGATCANSSECDEGFTCTPIQGGSNQCLPDNEYCDQYGSNIGLGQFCYGHGTCSSGICLVLSDEAYCTKQCSSSCGNGFACVGGYCLKAGTLDYGDACTLSSECETGTCIDFSTGGVCTMACGDNGGGSCPNGDQCLQDIYCAPPGPGSNGSPCYIATQCQGTYCVDSKCTQPCSGGASCPDGASCVGGWCVGAETGGQCTSNAQCADGLTCQLTGNGSSGSCVQVCSPLMEDSCSAGEVCVWAWQEWNQEISGSCQPKSGGGDEGDLCSASAPCELDLVCAEGVYGDMACHKDCKLYANALGCSPGYKCQSLEDPSDPKKGYCILKNPPPPPSEDASETPVEDTSTTDTGPVPDTATEPVDDTGISGEPPPEDYDSTAFAPDGLGVDADGSVVQGTPASGSSSGSSGCGATGGSTSSWLLPLLALIGVCAGRRRRHLV